MTKISRSITIQAPVSQVFDYLTDPQHLPEIWPSMVEVSHVERKPDGAHSFDWVYKMAGLNFKGHADTIQVERTKRVVSKNEKGIQSTFCWTYEPRGGETKVTMEVEYELPGTLLGKLAGPVLNKVNAREAETLLNNLKTKMETGASGATTAASQPQAAAH